MEVLVCPKCHNVIVGRKAVLTLLYLHLQEQHEVKATPKLIEEAEDLSSHLLTARIDSFYWPERVK